MHRQWVQPWRAFQEMCLSRCILPLEWRMGFPLDLVGMLPQGSRQWAAITSLQKRSLWRDWPLEFHILTLAAFGTHRQLQPGSVDTAYSPVECLQEADMPAHTGRSQLQVEVVYQRWQSPAKQQCLFRNPQCLQIRAATQSPPNCWGSRSSCLHRSLPRPHSYLRFGDAVCAV